MQEKVYTIGHGNKGLDELVLILKRYDIQTLVDIRSYPRSNRNPQFDREILKTKMPQGGISYEWLKGLGGYRKRGLGPESPHVSLKSQGFRNCADHMVTRTFKENIERLLVFARSGNACLMCAETLPFRCHRWILSDYLTANGIKVVHLIDIDKTINHRLSAHARVEGREVIYDRVTPTQGPFTF